MAQGREDVPAGLVGVAGEGAGFEPAGKHISGQGFGQPQFEVGAGGLGSAGGDGDAVLNLVAELV